MCRVPLRFTLFPYTTLFRSGLPGVGGSDGGDDDLYPYRTRATNRARSTAKTRGAAISTAPFTGERIMEKDFGESIDRKSTRLNSSHVRISYAVFCLKKKK